MRRLKVIPNHNPALYLREIALDDEESPTEIQTFDWPILAWSVVTKDRPVNEADCVNWVEPITSGMNDGPTSDDVFIFDANTGMGFDRHEGLACPSWRCSRAPSGTAGRTGAMKYEMEAAR